MGWGSVQSTRGRNNAEVNGGWGWGKLYQGRRLSIRSVGSSPKRRGHWWGWRGELDSSSIYLLGSTFDTCLSSRMEWCFKQGKHWELFPRGPRGALSSTSVSLETKVPMYVTLVMPRLQPRCRCKVRLNLCSCEQTTSFWASLSSSAEYGWQNLHNHPPRSIVRKVL